mmetsp:Transcript_2490/g.6703  ORF Transcript_2490/g.6703 Transcript_2490/m.6703 type:complete len:460 (-) Transcript_2490:126-1505(-)|eukprot:CAMPEP_0171196802 /NCGR_PEP_ID=MMETSP0790-20130122/22090_1 /TAXON_ID=2925 /ORGANISM="Alexandrium catenella, Strain OF101" /LENGTH=459 /DNA_ID=CAMNT_0011662037 /DNA_START=61 /DNA_END=1440 /DNA_ORIENTATION=+
MEKIVLGWEMSNTWLDPAMVILGSVVATLATVPVTMGLGWYLLGLKAAVVLPVLAVAGAWAWYNFSHLQDGPAPIDDYVEFKDDATKREWSGRRIPILLLCDLYLQDKISFKQDVLEVLRNHRNEFVNYKMCWSMFRFLIMQLFPNAENSSMKHLTATKKEIAEHYDRGNDWFESFLGPRMVYTSAIFEGLDQSLEVAQDNKMSLLCDKLMLKSDETILDIGCGWGTLLCHAAKNYGAKSVGVTLSVEGAKYCREQAKGKGLEEHVDVLCMDYREIPKDLTFNKIVSVEMAEHVGLKNFQIYLRSIKSMLKDDGMFMMQVAGLRQGSNWEDISWGLFMSRFIFPGADASTPLNWYIRQLEIAGFEVRSVETIGRHYSHTLNRWYDYFQKNRPQMEKTYGGYLCRLWDFFLAWSVVAAGQGSATCYQILSHKNIYGFERDMFCDKKIAQKSVGLNGRAKE